MDQEVIKVMLNDVLPGLLQKYILHDTVPVVVGGVPLNKCANDSISLINDIDIKFFEVWTKKEAYLKFLGIGLNTKMYLINTLNISMISTYRFSNFIYSICTEE